MSAEVQERLVQNIAATLATVSREDIIERSVGHFTNADAEYGRRVADAVKERRRQHKTQAIAPAHPGLK